LGANQDEFFEINIR